MKFNAHGSPENGHYETISDSAMMALIAFYFNEIGLPEDVDKKLSDLLNRKAADYSSLVFDNLQRELG